MAFPIPLPDPSVRLEGSFPLPIIPSVSWDNVPGSPATYFGAPRTEINPATNKPYPPHGACDLIAPHGTEVYAVAKGTIWYHRPFYHSYGGETEGGVFHQTCHQVLYELAVIHDDFIARYGEVAPELPPGIQVGQSVIEGLKIAYVGNNCASKQMLHFEMFFDQDRRDSLTNFSEHTTYKYVPQRNYQRRDDLLDPTPFLDQWALQAKMDLAKNIPGSLSHKRAPLK